MGINEIDLTIYPYTVGREDCRVLPRSFKTLAEAKAYLAKQDMGALEHGEFYLDGPEQDSTASNSSGAPIVNPETIVTAPTVADPAKVDCECTPIPIKSQEKRDAWTREIEELCRALEAPEKTH